MIGVVAHDAGGAEVLSAYLVVHPIDNVKYYLKGPAISIFQRQGLIGNDYVFNDYLNQNIKYLLLSMSWEDEITFEMLKKSKMYGIETEVILDSWYDYAQRFGSPRFGWHSFLPTTITVVDSIAEKIVSKVGLDKYCKIKKINNYYLEALQDRYKKLEVVENECNELLYLSAPLDKAKGLGLTELSATRTTQFDLLREVSSICNNSNITLRIRLHPSEDKENIDKYIDMLDCNFIISDNESILNDFRNARFVLGYSSLALIQSSVLGKTSISYQNDDLKDLFNWNEYGVYNYYGIKRVTNLMQIEKIISEK